LLSAVPAVAQESQLPTEAFLGSPSDGRVVMDTYGNCVRTSQWNLDRNIVGCGKAKPAPVAAVAPQQAQPAPCARRRCPAPRRLPPRRPRVLVRVFGCRRHSRRGPGGRPIPEQADAHGHGQRRRVLRHQQGDFRKEAQPELEKISARVRNVSSVEAVQITGFTDNTGTADYNQKLSEARASTVKDFLVKNGIDPSKITILGRGRTTRSPTTPRRKAGPRTGAWRSWSRAPSKASSRSMG
jgi:hypothetical protein